jgi:hypothetical protein
MGQANPLKEDDDGLTVTRPPQSHPLIIMVRHHRHHPLAPRLGRQQLNRPNRKLRPDKFINRLRTKGAEFGGVRNTARESLAEGGSEGF